MTGEDDDWNPDEYEVPEPTAEGKRKPKRPPPAVAIQLALVLGSDNQPTPCLANVMTVLSRHAQWRGVIAYDEFAQAVVSLKPPPVRLGDEPSNHAAGEWSEEDSIRTVAWITDAIGFAPRIDFVDSAVRAVARRNSFHPVRAYLKKLKWDKKPRLNTWLADYFGAERNEYTAGVGPRWLISAVARVMEPGCKADCMLVVEGLQGIGKSSAFDALAGDDWFADTPLNMGDKDSYQSLRRKWIYEMGELASIKGKEIEKVKNFVSARKDNYRPSFGKGNRDFPRQLVFCGTTNDDEYLVDRTGARRFWPVKGVKVDVAGLKRDRDQLWAEAFHRYQAKENWYVDTAEMKALCEAEQGKRRPQDAWLELLQKWVRSPRIERFQEAPITLYPEHGITVTEAILGCLKKREGDIKEGDLQKMGKTFIEMGWTKERRSMHHDPDRSYAYFPPVLGVTGVTGENKGQTSLSGIN